MRFQTLSTIILVCLAALAIMPSGAVASPVTYVLTDLGPCSINDAPQCITESGRVGMQMGGRAYVWEDGMRTPETGLPNNNVQMRINDLGHIAGANDQCAYIWRDGVTTPLGTLDNNSTYCYGINDLDQVVGTSISNSQQRGFLWQLGAMIDIGSIGPTGSTRPADINNAGQIVGSCHTATGTQPFLYQNGTMTQLMILPGYLSGNADAISENGKIAGTCNTEYYFQSQAMAWIDGQQYALGTLGQKSSWSSGINDAGSVVGFVGPSAGSPSAAFLWQDGTMYDLNSLLLNGSGYTVRRTYGINNAGQIVGTAGRGSETRAVLLTPVPEPSTVALLGIAGAGLLVCAWRCRNTRGRRFFG